MPRLFDVTTETTAAVSAVLTAFGERDYWLARMAAYGGDSMTLDRLEVESGGAITVATSQDLRHNALPSVFTRVLPGDLSIIRTETWHSAGDHEARGEVTIEARGVPGAGSGTAFLKPVPAGSQLQLTGTVEVRIPLLGGRIEQFIADLIAKEVPEMQRFTTEWICAHG